MASLCRSVGTEADLTATEAVAKISKNELTAEALVRACLERIDEVDDQIQAFAFLDRDLAIRQAQAVDGGRRSAANAPTRQLVLRRHGGDAPVGRDGGGRPAL